MKQGVITPVMTGDAPLYEQLYRYVVEEIRAGRLEEGDKLPSKRGLATHLGVSVSTVEGAYGLLCAEGYITAQPRSGYRICPILALAEIPPKPALKTQVFEKRPLKNTFSTAGVDASAFPYAAWARLMREAIREPNLLQKGDPQGDLSLRETLCAFLHQYRGVSCRPEQVVVGAGMEYLMGVLLQLLDRETVIGLENPGYHATVRAMEGLGRAWVPVAVDEYGLVPEALERSGAGAAYVTPSHQFPMGVTMPAGRRAELLRWAYQEPGRYLIEDDYDSEFRYTSRPIPAMQGLDGGRRVVYIGTFSRSIAPSIRAAYLILPEELLERYRGRFVHGASTVSRYDQQVLCRFLASGQYTRHLRRVGTLYRARCAALETALGAAFPEGEITGSGAGLHLLLTLPGRGDGDLVARAAAAGYEIHGLGEYCHGPSPKPGTLVLGFAGLPQEEAAGAAEELRAAFCIE